MNDRLVLVDTSAWILALRKDFHLEAKNKIEALLAEDRVAITPIIYLELLGGTKTPQEFKRLRARLSSLNRIPLTEEVWEEAAKFAFGLRRKGKTIPYTDILIGTVCSLHDLLLLHADRHFELMREEIPIRTESLLQA